LPRGEKDAAETETQGLSTAAKRLLAIIDNKTTERNNYGPRVRRVMPGGASQLLGMINGE